MDRQSLVALFDELEKIGQVQLDLEKLAAANPELYQLLKEAGVLEVMGKGAKRGAEWLGRRAKSGYQTVQTELGAMQAGAGRYGHHAPVKHHLGHTVSHLPEAAMAGAMKGGSPGAAALHLAPAAVPAITHAAKAGGRAIKRAVGKISKPGPMAPTLAPA